MSRKTVKISEVLELVNGMLKNSDDELVSQREGQTFVLEQLLHSTGNYKGFKYLSKDDMRDSSGGTTFGVGLYHEYSGTWNFDNTDCTRVEYF